MPRNGRSARAGAVRFAGFFSGTGNAALSSLAAAAGGGVTAKLGAENGRIGRAPQTTIIGAGRQGPKTGSRYARSSAAARRRDCGTALKHSVRNRYSIGRLRGFVPQRESLVERGDLVSGQARGCRPRRCRRHVPRSRLLESQTPSGSRVRKASATWRGEAPCASAIVCSSRARPCCAAPENHRGRTANRPPPRRRAVCTTESPRARSRAPSDDRAPGCRRSCPPRRPRATRRDRRRRNC